MAISQKIIWKYETPLQGEYLARSLFGGITPGLVSPLDVEIDETGAKLSIKSSFQCYIRPDNYYQAENSQGLLVKVEQEISGGDILSYTVLEDNAVALGMRYTWVSYTSQEAVIETLYYDDVTDNLTDYKGVILCCFDTVNKRVYPNMADFTLAYSQTVPALSGVGYRGLLPREFSNATQGNTADKNIRELIKYLQYSEGLVKSAKTVVPVSAVVGTDRVSKTFYISVPEYIKVDVCQGVSFPVYQILSYTNTYYVNSDEDVPEALSILYSDLSDSIDKIGIPSDQTALVALKRSSIIFNSQDDLVLDVSGSGVGSSDGASTFDNQIITERILVSDVDSSGNVASNSSRGLYIDKDVLYFSPSSDFSVENLDQVYQNGSPSTLLNSYMIRALFHCQPFSLNRQISATNTGTTEIFSNAFYFGFPDFSIVFGDDVPYSVSVDGFDGSFSVGRKLPAYGKDCFCFWYGYNLSPSVYGEDGSLVSTRCCGSGSNRFYPPTDRSLVPEISRLTGSDVFKGSRYTLRDYNGNTRDIYYQSKALSQVQANGMIIDKKSIVDEKYPEWYFGVFDLPVYPPDITNIDSWELESSKPKYHFIYGPLVSCEVIAQATIDSTQRFLRYISSSPFTSYSPSTGVSRGLQESIGCIDIVYFDHLYCYGLEPDILTSIKKDLSLDISAQSPDIVVYTIGDLGGRSSGEILDYNYYIECSGTGTGYINIKTTSDTNTFKPLLFIKNSCNSTISVRYGNSSSYRVDIPVSDSIYSVSIIAAKGDLMAPRVYASPVFSYFAKASANVSGSGISYSYATSFEKGLYLGMSFNQRMPMIYSKMDYEGDGSKEFDWTNPAMFQYIQNVPEGDDSYWAVFVYQEMWSDKRSDLSSVPCFAKRVYSGAPATRPEPTFNFGSILEKYTNLVSNVPKGLSSDPNVSYKENVYRMPTFDFPGSTGSRCNSYIRHCVVPYGMSFNLDYYGTETGHRCGIALSQATVIPYSLDPDTGFDDVSGLLYSSLDKSLRETGSTFFGTVGSEDGYFCLVANDADKVVTNLFRSTTFLNIVEEVVVPKVTEEVIKQLGDLPDRVTALETDVSSVQTDLTGAFDFQADKTVHNKLSEFTSGIETVSLTATSASITDLSVKSSTYSSGEVKSDDNSNFVINTVDTSKFSSNIFDTDLFTNKTTGSQEFINRLITSLFSSTPPVVGFLKNLVDVILPVGSIYTQYPVIESGGSVFKTEHEPANLWSGTQWEKLYSEDGVFFRTEGGEDESSRNSSTGVQSEAIGSHLHRINHGHTGSLSITKSGGHNHRVTYKGGLLYRGSLVSSVNDNKYRWLGYASGGDSEVVRDIELTASSKADGVDSIHTHTGSVTVASYSGNSELAGDVETRPKNVLIRVWLRVL